MLKCLFSFEMAAWPLGRGKGSGLSPRLSTATQSGLATANTLTLLAADFDACHVACQKEAKRRTKNEKASAAPGASRLKPPLARFRLIISPWMFQNLRCFMA
jgi:hypothetical protein